MVTEDMDSRLGLDVDTRVTILDVFLADGNNAPWRALVQPPRGKAVFLELSNPPAGAQAGEDIRMHGRIIHRQGALPDLALVDAGLRAHSLAPVCVSDAVDQRFMHVPSGEGTESLARGRVSADPVVDWAMRRFRGGDCATSPLVLVLEPMAGAGCREDGTSGLVRFMPAAVDADAAIRYCKHLSQGYAGVAAISRKMSLTRARLVVPYDAADTGCSGAATTSCLCPPDGWMPREPVRPLARRMLMAAHEMAHVRQVEWGLRSRTVQEMHEAENFADAVSLMTFVLDTADVESALAIARQRALAPLAGMFTHATGLSCAAAVQAALSMAAQGGQSPVPMDRIMDEAAAISRTFSMPDPAPHEAVRRFLGRDPDWMFASRPAMLLAMDNAMRCAGVDARSVEGASLLAVMDALPRAMYTPADLASPRTRTEALRVERMDLELCICDLLERASGHVVPVMLDREMRRLRSHRFRENTSVDPGAALAVERGTLPDPNDFAMHTSLRTIPFVSVIAMDGESDLSHLLRMPLSLRMAILCERIENRLCCSDVGETHSHPFAFREFMRVRSAACSLAIVPEDEAKISAVLSGSAMRALCNMTGNLVNDDLHEVLLGLRTALSVSDASLGPCPIKMFYHE